MVTQQPQNSTTRISSGAVNKRFHLAGTSVPYPSPASPAASAMARGNRGRDTRPELFMRSALHRRGLRFRVGHVVRLAEVRVTVDVAFTRARLAVFVDGCFWHGCPLHQRVPKRNSSYWARKLRLNAARDQRVDVALRAAGWMTVRVWEHEDPQKAAARIAGLLNCRTG
jgi:DNA mismatch endonuclease (patch repair protein)